MAGPEELSRLEEILRRPDFVLEPACLPTVISYVKAGGAPPTVVEILSDGYIGTAHMAALMCKWLDSADDKAESGPGSSRAGPSGQGSSQGGRAPSSGSDEYGFLQEIVRSRFNPDRVSDVFTSRGGKPPPWLDGLIADPRGRSLIYSLSASHRNCLLLNFAIQKILMQGHEDEVASVGSSLASYFTVFHRLLAARLRTALSACGATAATATNAGPGGNREGSSPRGASPSPGPYGEASTGAGLSTSTYNPAQGAQNLRALAKELSDSCAHAAHTYLHAQQLLQLLARHPQGAAFARLSQDVEAAAASSQPGPLWSTLRLLLPRLPAADEDERASVALLEAAAITGKVLAASPSINPSLAAPSTGGDGGSTDTKSTTDSLPYTHSSLFGTYSLRPDAPDKVGLGYSSSVGGAGPLPGPDIIRLASLYHELAGSSYGAAYLALIQHPALLQALISGVFVPGKPPHHEVLDAALTLLARATSTPSPRQQAQDASRQEHDGAGPSAPPSLESVLESGCEEGGWLEAGPEVEARVEATKQALRAVLTVGSRAGGKIGPEDVSSAQQLVRLPVAAAALLGYMRHCLLAREWYSESAASKTAALVYTRLAVLVARAQPELVPTVVDLLARALAALGSQRSDVSGAMCSALVTIMCDAAADTSQGGAVSSGSGDGGAPGAGAQVPAAQLVMRVLGQWAGDADPSLVRPMVFTVLKCCAPPYTPPFASWLLGIMTRGSVMRRGRDSHKGSRNAELLREFAGECRRLAAAAGLAAAGGSGLVLGPREQALLQELSADR